MALQSVISSSRIPMVIILGATGTGKTKLGVELAQKFRTEIISADSMQIYKGLNVVTAKATKQEQEAATHHLLDELEPHQMFTVVDFRNRALKIIDKLTTEGKIPIVVGGTAYYMESIVYQILVENTTETKNLLWDRNKRKRDDDESTETEAKKLATEINDDDNNMEESVVESKTSKEAKDVVETTTSEEAEDVVETKTSKEAEDVVETTTSKEEMDKTVDVPTITKDQLQEFLDTEKKYTNEEIHNKLKSVDPVMAERLHPNNRRKVIRSLEVWLATGKKHSDILDEQKLSEGKLRKPGETLVFWLKCEQSVHEARLDARVDAMLQQGLIQELLDFHARHNKQRIQDGKPPDYTKGIFQTLGFKEFHDYLMMTEEEKNSEDGKKLLQQSIENMKLATKRYARRQNKMIRGRFLNHINREVPPIYELDTTDVSKWDENVKDKAITIIESILNDIECEYEPLKQNIAEITKLWDSKSNNYCNVCQRIIIGDKEYDIHMNSIRHNKVVKKKEAEAKKEKEKQEKERKKQEENKEIFQKMTACQ